MKIYFDELGEFKIEAESDDSSTEVFGRKMNLQTIKGIKVIEGNIVPVGSVTAPSVRIIISKQEVLDVEFDTLKNAINCAQFLFIIASSKGNFTLPLPKVITL